MNPAVINDPVVLAEVTAVFHAYEHALMGNDRAALNAFFWADPRVTRYGIADRQWGIDELVAFRAATSSAIGRDLQHLRVTSFGRTWRWRRSSSCAATPRCAVSRARPGSGSGPGAAAGASSPRMSA